MVDLRVVARLGLACTIVLALAAALASTAGAQEASIEVSPSTVEAGGPLTVSGEVPVSGPMACPVDDAVIVTSDAALFPPDGFGPSAPRDAAGMFEIVYEVPVSTPAGSYDLGLRCGGGNVGVAAAVTVTGETTTTTAEGDGENVTSTTMSEDGDEDDEATWWWVVAIVGGLIVVVAVGAVVARRRA